MDRTRNGLMEKMLDNAECPTCKNKPGLPEEMKKDVRNMRSRPRSSG